MKLESCWKRNSIESLKKTEGNIFGKVNANLEECFESWQAILSQFMRKPEENHRWKRNSIESLKKTEGNLCGKVNKIL